MNIAMKKSVIIGTRKSLLALWQSHYIKACLEERYPNLTLSLIHI